MSTSRRLLIQFLVGLLSVFLISFGRPYRVPDNIQKLHGLPLTWGIHQIATIVGPVDTWMVRVSYLVIDMVFWIFLVIVSPLLYERFNVVSCEMCLEEPE
jgi:hypothetical protein